MKHEGKQGMVVGVIVVVIVTLIGLAFVGPHVWRSQQVASILEDLRDRNHPLTLRALDDSYSIPASESNAAPIYAKAFDAYKEYPSSLDGLWKRAEEPADQTQQRVETHFTQVSKNSPLRWSLLTGDWSS